MHKQIYSKFVRSLARLKLQPNDGDKVAIALSGGPDSVALAALTAKWHYQSHLAIEPPLALVVDHRLRPESADEAHQAACLAAEMGLRSRVLTVDWGGNIPRPQQKMRAAREARYGLLMEACHEAGVAHLMTAHHADDQAETFLLRLIHASGIDGLAGIAPINRTFVPSHGARILRPLLDLHKEELTTFCKELDLQYALDPTNNDGSYQRNRLRQLLQEAAASSDTFSSSLAAESLVASSVSTNHQQKSSIHYVNGINGHKLVNGSTICTPTKYQPPQIVRDILKLQKICAKASANQQKGATALLRRTLLHVAPVTKIYPQPPVKDIELQGGFVPYTTERRRIHWPSQLDALSKKASHVPHAIIQIRPFASVESNVAAAAVSRLLQAVSGTAYPPGSSLCAKLAQRFAEGKLVGSFTGGKCTVQPVTHSKGRYVLIVPQTSQAHVLELLHEKPAAFRKKQKHGQEVGVEVEETAFASAAVDKQEEEVVQQAVPSPLPLVRPAPPRTYRPVRLPRSPSQDAEYMQEAVAG